MKYLINSIGVVICTMVASVNFMREDWGWVWAMGIFAVLDLVMLCKQVEGDK